MFSPPPYRATAALLPGPVAVSHLEAFLPETRAVLRLRTRVPRQADSIAAWASGPVGARARRLAERLQLPLFALEHGFVRPLGRTDDGAGPLSLVVDPIGIHYDATRPSALEVMLQSGDDDFAMASGDAITALARVQGERLGLTNTASEVGPADIDTGQRPLVLVVDQSVDDPSIGPGLATGRSFDEMLEAAIDENPDAALLVVAAPDPAYRRSGGHLGHRARRLGIAVLDRQVNTISLVEHAARVYTVTSQLGMEALICGAQVTCFGMPYYAGWGATDDRVACPRRTRRHSPLSIFAAAYLRYARYVDPLTGEACAPAAALERLAVMKRADERNRGHTECLGVERRKRRYVRPFLTSTGGSVAFSGSADRALARAGARPAARLCVWGGRAPGDLPARARRAGVPLVRVDEGVLATLGLTPQNSGMTSLVFDRRAMEADPARLGELEEMLEFETFDEEVLERAARLRERLLELGRWRDFRREVAPGFERSARRRILVIGDAPGDAPGAGGSRDADLDLLRAVHRARPDGSIVFLPDPKSARRLEDASTAAAVAGLCDHVLRAACPHAAIACADEVHVRTSPRGFEALLRGCKVVAHGPAFYAGWGLTEDRVTFSHRTRRLTLDQLVAGALILHPVYVDPVTHLLCDVETVIERLEQQRAAMGVPSFRRYVRLVGRALRGASQVARQAG